MSEMSGLAKKSSYEPSSGDKLPLWVLKKNNIVEELTVMQSHKGHDPEKCDCREC
jgi:hypothetical protein